MNVFSSGIVVFFRHLDTSDRMLVRSLHPEGRDVQDSQSGDYLILSEDREILGIYPRDWVACILPMQTVGPAHANDKQV